MKSLIVLIALALGCAAQSTTDIKRDSTFKDVRRVLLNQKVIVRGAIGTSRNQDVIVGWDLGRKTDNGFATDGNKQLPATYHGNVATVVQVELLQGILDSTETKNALGEPISREDKPNPYFRIFAQFDDGTIAIHSGFPGTIDGEFELASSADALTAQMDKDLPSTVGKHLYAVGYSKLYRADTSLQEIIGFEHKGLFKQLSSTDVPLLEPLDIVAAKYIEADDVIVLKVKLPSGAEALSVTRSSSFRDSSIRSKTLLARIGGTLLDEIPPKLTAKEIDAIKKTSIFRGMSHSALIEMLGFADKENEVGAGNRQIVFFDGRLLVYEDRNDKVTDWQSLDK